jgi:serine/threonine protein kinase
MTLIAVTYSTFCSLSSTGAVHDFCRFSLLLVAIFWLRVVLSFALLCCAAQVMELCEGGELFDQIVAYGQFSEEDAVGIIRSLLSFVDYAHSKHIVHR